MRWAWLGYVLSALLGGAGYSRAAERQAAPGAADLAAECLLLGGAAGQGCSDVEVENEEAKIAGAIRTELLQLRAAQLQARGNVESLAKVDRAEAVGQQRAMEVLPDEASSSQELDPASVGVPEDDGAASLDENSGDNNTGNGLDIPAVAAVWDWNWKRVISVMGSGSQVGPGTDRWTFDKLFRRCPVVRYVRNGATHSVYVRETAVAVDPTAIFAETWASNRNMLNRDFRLYDSVADAVARRNAWTFCNYDDPDVGYPRDCGRFGSVGNQWFSMPGGRFNARGLYSGAAFDVYTGPGCPSPVADSNWKRVISVMGSGSQVGPGTDRWTFDRLFRRCPVVRYVRNGKTHSVYVRETAVAVDPTAIFAETWASNRNMLNRDFRLYDSVADAVARRNAWTFCNYDDPDVGYPRDCGRFGSVGNQWFSMPGGRYNARGLFSGAAFDVYTGPGCPSPVAQQR